MKQSYLLTFVLRHNIGYNWGGIAFGKQAPGTNATIFIVINKPLNANNLCFLESFFKSFCLHNYGAP